jgi:hypothetical protein
MITLHVGSDVDAPDQRVDRRADGITAIEAEAGRRSGSSGGTGPEPARPQGESMLAEQIHAGRACSAAATRRRRARFLPPPPRGLAWLVDLLASLVIAQRT